MAALRRIARLFFFFGVALTLGLALAFGAAQTTLGKRWLAAAIGAALSDREERVVVTGITGLVPFDIAIDRIEAIDAAGPRATVAKTTLALAPRDLLAGHVRATRLAIGTVEVLRRDSGSGSLARLLNLPFALRIDNGTIERLTLGRDLVGEQIEASLSGSLALGRGEAGADVALRPIDGTPGEATLHAVLGGTPLRLELVADIAEPGGRWLAERLGRPQPLPLMLHFAGTGPLADWRGTLSARAGADATLDAAFRLAAGETSRLSLEGDARLASLLPPPAAHLLGEDAHLSAAAHMTDATLAVDALAVVAAVGTLQASGHVDRGSGDFVGDAALATPDLARLSPLLDHRALGGAATTTLALGGSAQGWNARVAIDAREVSLDGNAVAAARATVDLGAAGDLRAASPIALSGSGAFEGLAPAQGPLPDDLGRHLAWRGAARLDRGTARITVDELTLASAGATLTARLAAGAAGVDGSAELSVPDLAPLVEEKLRGGLALAGDFHADADGSGVVVLSGALEQLQSGSADLDRLLGPRLALAGTLRRGADGALSAADVSLEGAQLRVAGNAALGADRSTRAELTLSGAAIAAGGIALDALDARLALSDLRQPAGRLEASFRGRGIDGVARAEGVLVPGDTLRLTSFHLAAAKTRLDGALTLDLARSRADGSMTATTDDLAPWSTLLGTPLGGSAELKARLSGSGDQSLEASLVGRNLRLGAGSARRVEASLRLADMLGKAAGRGTLALDAAALGAVRLERLTLGGNSDRPGRFTLTLAARGTLAESFALDGGATLSLSPDRRELRVTRLAGSLGRESLQLRRPLLLTAADGGLAFADLDLAFGKGRITGAGASKGEILSLHLLGAQLPVQGLADLAATPGVSGVLGFEATLRGTRARPEAEIVIDGENLRIVAAHRSDLPALGLVAEARWRGEEVAIKGRLAAPGDAALGFSGRVPLQLAREDLVPRPPPGGALALRLEGEGELANFAELLPSGEDRFAGHFRLGIDVDGTVAAPRASGTLSLDNGFYESRVSGTRFAGVGFDLVGNRDQLVLQRFAATDGANGTARLEGALDLGAAAGPTFRISGNFASFRALDSDDATATMSGSVGLGGSLLAPRLEARLTIDAAELRIPNQLPQNLRPIPVTIVDSATGTVLVTPEESESAGRAALLALALDVEVLLPGHTFVRGRGLDSEWRGDIRITGTTAAPSIVGKLMVVQGTYAFLGKTATLSRGTITFLGGRRVDPAVDIVARASSTELTAIVHIGGTATQPTIQLSSEPALPQDEILSRLLFGTGASRLGAGQALQLAQAGASLAGGGDLGLLDRLRQGLGLDRLTFGSSTPSNAVFNTIATPTTPAGVPNIFAPGATSSIAAPLGAASGVSSVGAISAGKYIASGIYVGVTQGIDAGSSSVGVQIDVTRNISIDTTAGAETGEGVGVSWKLDY
jgi:translocation and assembly module TamB